MSTTSPHTRALWSLPYQLERCLYDLETYVDAIVEAKRQGLPVKLGLEVDWVGERQHELAAVLDPYPWDYLLGSVHWIDGLGVDEAPGIWVDRSVEDVWAVYFAALGQLAASGPRGRSRPPRPRQDLREAPGRD